MSTGLTVLLFDEYKTVQERSFAHELFHDNIKRKMLMTA
jgi:hypothetical protein